MAESKRCHEVSHYTRLLSPATSLLTLSFLSSNFYHLTRVGRLIILSKYWDIYHRTFASIAVFV
jgi:hypothetical protein